MANGTLKVSNIETSSGSGTITLGQSGETVDMSNGTITLNSSMKNTPAFKATLSGDQSISDNTTVKITFDTETFDTDSAFASNKFTVPSGQAGKYNIISQLTFYDGSDHITKVVLSIYKNGSAVTEAIFNLSTEDMGRFALCNSNILDLAVSDYIEIYGYADTSDSGTFQYYLVINKVILVHTN